jgi:hypothetical protein
MRASPGVAYIRRMDPSNLLLAQAITLSGLIGASGAYAGIVRRRGQHRLEAASSAAAGQSAVDRVERSLILGRLDHTFIRSAYLPHGRYPDKRRR